MERLREKEFASEREKMASQAVLFEQRERDREV
jgi:hypothetical protein